MVVWYLDNINLGRLQKFPLQKQNVLLCWSCPSQYLTECHIIVKESFKYPRLPQQATTEFLFLIFYIIQVTSFHIPNGITILQFSHITSMDSVLKKC